MGEEISFGIERVSLSRSELVSDLKETDESTVDGKPDHNHSIADVSTNCSAIENNVDRNLLVAFDGLLCHDIETTSLANSTRTKLHSIDCSDSIADVRVNQLTSFNSKICIRNNRDYQFDEIHLPRQLKSINLMPNVSNPSFAGTVAENSTQNHTKNNFSKIFNKYNDCSKNYESITEFPDSSVRDKSITGTFNFVLRVEKSLREWCTVDTLTFILGVESVKQMMLEKGRIFETREPADCDSYLYDRYATIFKKLKILKMEKEKYSNEAKLFEKPSRPLPDFAILQKQTQEMNIKVRAFYCGDKKVTFHENKNGTSVVLPTLHQHTKMAIRRNVVLDKLKKM